VGRIVALQFLVVEHCHFNQIQQRLFSIFPTLPDYCSL
jgi:hypothetical protein